MALLGETLWKVCSSVSLYTYSPGEIDVKFSPALIPSEREACKAPLPLGEYEILSSVAISSLCGGNALQILLSQCSPPIPDLR